MHTSVQVTLEMLPEDMRAALQYDEAAREKFTRFAPSHQRDYLNWISEASKPDTRRRRIERMLDMILANP